MTFLPHRAGAALAVAAGVAALSAAPASAATTVPSFARCPVDAPNVVGCVVQQSIAFVLKSAGRTVPVTNYFKVEGAIAQDPETEATSFVPPVTGSALSAAPVEVPGAFGIKGLPAKDPKIKLTIEQVGPIRLDFGTFDLAVPVRLKLTNSALGSSCGIGSAASPISLNLTTGDTAPPPPTPVASGVLGELIEPEGATFGVLSNIAVDNVFSIPVATGCNPVAGKSTITAINKALGLPAKSGANYAYQKSNVFFKTTIVEAPVDPTPPEDPPADPPVDPAT